MSRRLTFLLTDLFLLSLFKRRRHSHETVRQTGLTFWLESWSIKSSVRQESLDKRMFNRCFLQVPGEGETHANLWFPQTESEAYTFCLWASYLPSDDDIVIAFNHRTCMSPSKSKTNAGNLRLREWESCPMNVNANRLLCCDWKVIIQSKTCVKSLLFLLLLLLWISFNTRCGC